MSDGWCPFAAKRRITEDGTQPGITPRCVIVHSQGGRGSLYGFWQKGSSLESHFWIGSDGTIEQYLRVTVRADANGEANRWREGSTYFGGVSIETESSVSATERWTPAQAASLARLLIWLCNEYRIPKRQMRHKTDGGIGWHVMFGAPGPWTQARGKVCPGKARIPQLVDEIIPLVAGDAAIPPNVKGALMALSDKEQAELFGLVKANNLLLQNLVGDLIPADSKTKGKFSKRVIDSLTRIEGK